MPNVHFSSETVEWYTPPEVFDPLKLEFGLEWDVCASPGAERLSQYWSPAQDGLIQDWAHKRCWMNPPYGREIKHWVKKARWSGAAVVVGLLPARTDTAWWHDYVLPHAEVRFMRGRVKFMKPDGTRASSAPFPTAICIWR